MAEGTNLAFVTNGAEIVNGATISGKLPNGYNISIAAGATVTLSSVTISATSASGIVCNGNANLVLSGTNNITSSIGCGIQAGGSGTTLTISGEGSLTTVASNYGNAGIGSLYYSTCGDLKFTGGNISATGAMDGPGIGAGDNGQCGMITISDGAIITAIGTSDGSGIGTGCSQSSCGDITINGGSVTASSTDGAGIGSGYNGTTCGNITISGGSVQATGEIFHPGIGAGWSSSAVSRCGDILISGGTVTATGGMYAAAIGSGYGNEGDPEEPDNPPVASECGTITIKSTVTQVTANRGDSAPNAIGAGEFSNCGTVTIEDGANVIQN